MKVFSAPEELPRLPKGTAVTIGAYDGVHLGHRDLIARTLAEGDRLKVASAVVTFDRHPATLVRPDSAPLLLTDSDQRLELLAATGLDIALVVRFDAQRADEAAEHFVTTVLAEGLAARSVVVGRDFHFGKGRRGNVELLRRLGEELGFSVTGIPLLASGGDEAPVTSTRIRDLLGAGAVEEAAALLARPHQVRGVVIEGDRRGRALGFPTANIEVPRGICLPADGVYAGWYHRPDGTRHAAAVSLGGRPQFYGAAGTSLLEAHLVGFDGHLYGERAAVDFVTRLRSQARFDSIDALIERISLDVEAVRSDLAAGAA